MAVVTRYLFPVVLWRWAISSDSENFTGSAYFARNYLTGNSGNDTISGCGFDYTVIHGEGGNDRLIAGDCPDEHLYGDDGNDVLIGGQCGDYLDGGQGNDTIYGMAGNDVISDIHGNNHIDGNDGNDHIYTRDGVQNVWGDAGNDRIVADNAQIGSTFHGGGGNDEITVNGDGVLVHGDEDNDTITFNSYATSYSEDDSQVYGDAGNDYIKVSGGYVDIEGGLGADTIDFTNGGNNISHYNAFNESPLHAGDTLKHFGFDNNKVDITNLDTEVRDLLFWADNSNDHRAGAVYLQNNWTNSKLYAYSRQGDVFELTFVSSARLTHDMFVL